MNDSIIEKAVDESMPEIEEILPQIRGDYAPVRDVDPMNSKRVTIAEVSYAVVLLGICVVGVFIII